MHQSGRRRQQSISARTSPIISPLQAFTPVEQAPHRTHSSPHLARISPIIYGYGYQYPSHDTGDQSQFGLLDNYFALPPPQRRSADMPFLDGDEVPPPYTASQVELQALVRAEADDQPAHEHRGQQEHENRNEEQEGEEAVLSFSTESRRGVGLRRRGNGDVDVVDTHEASAKNEDRLEHSRVRAFVLVYILVPLRLLAVVPGCIGTFWLLRNAVMLLWLEGSAWQRSGHPSALEFGLASLWSIATAYHALSFTTLLLRRWLHYYSLLPSFIRLIALQAICWPLVRITLFILGSRNPLAGWVIVSTTTAFSDTVARWVVSNITEDYATGISEQPLQSSSVSMLRNRKRRRHTSRAFWRAVMGGPSDRPPSSSGSHSSTHRRPTTESEAESDYDVVNRRRRSQSPWADGHQSEVTSGGEESSVEPGAAATLHPSQRVARFFHWDVAVRRNVLPIAILGYLSLWALLVEQVRQRA